MVKIISESLLNNMRGRPAAGFRCDLSFYLTLTWLKTFKDIFTLENAVLLSTKQMAIRGVKEALWRVLETGWYKESACEKQICPPTCLLLIEMLPSSWDQSESEGRGKGQQT